MPKKIIDYSKTVIYKICCKDPSIKDVYVGSTTDKIRRKASHKIDCNNPERKQYNCYVYQFIRDHGGFDNWDFIVIEEYPCKNKEKKLLRERYWLEQLKASLNKRIPSRTPQQYHEENKDKINTKNREYYKNNKEKLQGKHKQYNVNNKEKVKITRKEYALKNIDKLKEYRKEYNSKNKDKIVKYRQEHKSYASEQAKIRYHCICGCSIGQYDKQRHFRSNKHKQYLVNKQMFKYIYETLLESKTLEDFSRIYKPF